MKLRTERLGETVLITIAGTFTGEDNVDREATLTLPLSVEQATEWRDHLGYVLARGDRLDDLVEHLTAEDGP